MPRRRLRFRARHQCELTRENAYYTVGKGFCYVSTYQYYEFQAIDRPLEQADREALRRLSSRADITSTRFTNVYNFGDFHGEPRKLMERWFDLHLYLADWGTRRIMIRLPKRLVDPSRIDGFVSEVDEVELFESGENLIVDVRFDSESEEYSYSDEQGDGWLDSLAPLRNDMLAGDLRLFYILWLTAVERGLLADDRKEPLPGIGSLSAPLEAFAKFFDVDRDLVRAAAESPASSDDGDSFADASRKAITSIPEDEKTALLLRLVNGDVHVAAELRNNIRVAWDAKKGQSRVRRRTVAEIRKRSLAVREERRAEEAKRKEAERLRKAQEAARAQRVRLDSIRRRGARVWDEVEREIGYKSASSYDRAVELLVDLRALARETGAAVAFANRLQSIRERHERKRRFIERLNAHRLGLG